MLTIQIIGIGKIKEPFWKAAISEYEKRLSKYCKLNILELQDEKIPDKLNPSLAEEIKSKECSHVMQHIPQNSMVICLDLNGKEYSSEEFSKKIQTWSMTNSHLTFIIGGSLGLNSEILQKADQKICFSKLTFPHQLIRVFLLEQIFRCFKIANGETYHR